MKSLRFYRFTHSRRLHSRAVGKSSRRIRGILVVDTSIGKSLLYAAAKRRVALPKFKAENGTENILMTLQDRESLPVRDAQ